MSSRNNASKSTTSKKTNSKASVAKKRGGAHSQQEQEADFFDARMKNEIVGVVIAVFSIGLFIAVVSQSHAVLANFASTCLLYGFGIGAYVIPIALFFWSTTFFIRTKEGSIWRIGIGLSLIVIAILSLLAVYTPGATADAMQLFQAENLCVRGGYLGAGIAWVLLKLVGKTIASVILFGVAVVGVVVIGFSISKAVQKSQDLLGVARMEHQAQRVEMTQRRTVQPRKRAGIPVAGDQLGLDTLAGQTEVANASDKTAVLPTRKSKRGSAADKTVETASKATVAMPGKNKGALGNAPSALVGFDLPPQDLLKVTPAQVMKQQSKDSASNLKELAGHLQETLESFSLYAQVVGWVAGPTFTMFKVEMPTGVKLNKITSLQDDIALALAAESVRIFAPIPGTSLVGIEVPNKNRVSVLLGDMLPAISGGPLMIGLGKDVEGDMIAGDLATMPHLLIGGATGSGKSVAINSILMSILMRATPAEVRMILIDPKRVELSLYNGIPHLYVPVVTDPKEAAAALAWATIEMDRRLKVFQKAGTRNIGLYNSMVQDDRLGDDAEELPYIVIVIDELADLMMVAGKEVEGSIVRIAQLARAAGIHLIVATQRPSSNVVTGMIKANIVNRISFKVATSVDSRVILDQSGSEKLIGLGDLLFLRGDGGEPKRIQGCYVSEDETVAVVEHLKEQGDPEYHEEILKTNVVGTAGLMDPSTGGDDFDPLIWEAAEIVVASQMGSTSNIQRRLRVGYSRAGRIMDQLEAKGVVGPPDGSRPREVLVSDVVELESFKALDEYDKVKEDFS